MEVARQRGRATGPKKGVPNVSAIDWQTDLDAALDRARRERRIVLLDFYALPG
jgi:thiol:disulfide interchange protein